MRRDLGQPPLDGGVDVLVRLGELERAGVQLTLDAAQATLDGCELRRLQDSGRSEAPRMRDAARDVEGIELEVDLERGGEGLQLREQPPLEPTSPQLLVLAYGASLLTSPSRSPSSRACSRPWTWAAVRTPMPHSLMKPAAADWSNVSPFP